MSDCRSAPICEEAERDDLAMHVTDAFVSNERESFCVSSLEERGKGDYRHLTVQGPNPRWKFGNPKFWPRVGPDHRTAQRVDPRVARVERRGGGGGGGDIGRLRRIILGMMGEVKKRNPGVERTSREVMFIFREVDKRPYVDIYVGRVQTRSFDWSFIKVVLMVSVLYHPRHGRWIGLARLGADWRNLGVQWISWALPDIDSDFANHTQIKICFR